jgi:GxxExxY protein
VNSNENRRKTADTAEKKNAQKMDVTEINKLSEKVIGLAIKVHKKLGPGFTEKIYEKALVYELEKGNIEFSNQVEIAVHYDLVKLGRQRIDFIIEDETVVELKSASSIIKLFESQLISYLKATGKRIGLILNFGRKKLEIRRLVNKL